MAIEFRCIRCGQRLRVPEEDRGKRARCPTCIAIVDIPGEEGVATPILLSRERSDVIDYELFGEESQYVEITLDPGEVTVARLEHLLYMSPGIATEPADTDSSSGLLDRISQVSRRILTDSALRMTAFCNVAEQREVVAFAPTAASRLLPVHLDEYDNQITCQGAAILCAARGTEINEASVPVVSDYMAMNVISGDGIAVLQCPGQLFHRDLKRGKSLAVRAYSVVAFTSGISVTPHETASVDEQTPIATLRGPGEIWLQTGV